MVPVRPPLVRRFARAVCAAAASVAAAAGCATFSGLSKDLHELDPFTAQKAPAVELACGWQNRLATLPDPLRNGAPTPGIAGQIFLFGTGGKPADPAGELTVNVSDATPRPPGAPGHTAEVWHFANATLKNLQLADYRFGPCFVVFLPWPESWRDVTKVRFQARYDQPGGPTLYSQEADVTLDFSPSPSGVIPGAGGGTSVPNPTDVLKQARQAQAAGRKVQPGFTAPPVGTVPATGVQPAAYPPPGYYQTPSAPPVNLGAGATYPPGYGPPVQPAGYYPPPTGYGPPAAPPGYGPPPVYGPPAQAGPYGPAVTPAGANVQPGIVPFRPPGTELATQGPQEIRTLRP